jgi:hypothetical protein
MMIGVQQQLLQHSVWWCSSNHKRSAVLRISSHVEEHFIFYYKEQNIKCLFISRIGVSSGCR